MTVPAGELFRFSRVEVDETSHRVVIAAFLKAPKEKLDQMRGGPITMRGGPAEMHRAAVKLTSPLGDRRVVDARDSSS